LAAALAVALAVAFVVALLFIVLRLLLLSFYRAAGGIHKTRRPLIPIWNRAAIENQRNKKKAAGSAAFPARATSTQTDPR
jgi:hypothetical protein